MAVGRITIGANSVVGANALVIKDVPENAVMGGVPARFIREKPPVSETVLPLKETSDG